MENKYNCDAYDDGYCYRLGKPLSDEEDDKCEDCCICNTKNQKKSIVSKEANNNVVAKRLRKK